jgi:hypothetical protein
VGRLLVHLDHALVEEGVEVGGLVAARGRRGGARQRPVADAAQPVEAVDDGRVVVGELSERPQSVALRELDGGLEVDAVAPVG